MSATDTSYFRHASWLYVEETYMLHLFLDTSIFRANPERNSAAFQVVARIGNSGGLTIHIPYVVRREFLTHREDEYVGPLDEAQKQLQKLSRRQLPTELEKNIKQAQELISNSTPISKGWVHEEFDLWCAQAGAKKYKVANHHGLKVLDAYFNGSEPFKSVKNRNDFPDAFIFESVTDLSQSFGQLNAVIADNKLRDSCETLDGVFTFSTLDEFVRSPSFQATIKDTFISQHFEKLIALIIENPVDIEEEASNALFEQLSMYTITDRSILDDNHEALVTMLDIPSSGGLDWASAEYYGSGIVTVPLEFKTEVLADYYIFKSDWYALGEERASTISISEYDNRHYFEAQEEFELLVSGAIALSLDVEEAGVEGDAEKLISGMLNSVKFESAQINDVAVLNREDFL